VLIPAHDEEIALPTIVSSVLHGVVGFRYQPDDLSRLDSGDDRLLAEGWPEFIDAELSIHDYLRLP
jgi:hypothetical protein